MSIINIIDEIASPSFPVALPKIAIAASLVRTQNEENNIHCRAVLNHNNNVLFQTDLAIAFLDKIKARAVAVLHGVILPGPGTLRISLFTVDEEMAYWEILVTAIGQPQVDLFNPAPAA